MQSYVVGTEQMEGPAMGNSVRAAANAIPIGQTVGVQPSARVLS
jgi:uncharacterized protein YcsI (UPF0317 family)